MRLTPPNYKIKRLGLRLVHNSEYYMVALYLIHEWRSVQGSYSSGPTPVYVTECLAAAFDKQHISPFHHWSVLWLRDASKYFCLFFLCPAHHFLFCSSHHYVSWPHNPLRLSYRFRLPHVPGLIRLSCKPCYPYLLKYCACAPLPYRQEPRPVCQSASSQTTFSSQDREPLVC